MRPEPVSGNGIIRADTVGTGVFAVIATIEAVTLARWTEVVGVAVALGLFALGCSAFLLAYGRALQRSRTEEISVLGLYLLSGDSIPKPVKRRLNGLLVAQIVIALVTASLRPFTTLAFGILAPVFGLGLNGLWAARHGLFPARQRASRGKAPRVDGPMEQNAEHG